MTVKDYAQTLRRIAEQNSEVCYITPGQAIGAAEEIEGLRKLVEQMRPLLNRGCSCQRCTDPSGINGPYCPRCGTPMPTAPRGKPGPVFANKVCAGCEIEFAKELLR